MFHPNALDGISKNEFVVRSPFWATFGYEGFQKHKSPWILWMLRFFSRKLFSEIFVKIVLWFWLKSWFYKRQMWRLWLRFFLKNKKKQDLQQSCHPFRKVNFPANNIPTRQRKQAGTCIWNKLFKTTKKTRTLSWIKKWAFCKWNLSSKVEFSQTMKEKRYYR